MNILQNPKTFKFGDKEVTLTTDEMYDVMSYFERYCTAEYVLDRYDKLDEEQAWDIAGEVRSKMADCPGLTEGEALSEVMYDYEDEDDEDYEDEDYDD